MNKNVTKNTVAVCKAFNLTACEKIKATNHVNIVFLTSNLFSKLLDKTLDVMAYGFNKFENDKYLNDVWLSTNAILTLAEENLTEAEIIKCFPADLKKDDDVMRMLKNNVPSLAKYCG